jgi:hypothetical protein
LRYVVEDFLSTVTFWPADVDTVKLDVDTLLTLPTTPPAAGPDRALAPALPANPAVEVAVCPVLAPAEPLPDVALTIPNAPPPSTTTAAPIARSLVSLSVNMRAPSLSISQKLKMPDDTGTPL